MNAVKFTLASFASACVLLGCAGQSQSVAEAPTASEPSPTLYLAAEKATPTTKPTAWIKGDAQTQSGNHLQEPAAQKQLPAGHPQVAQPQQGQLPAGHPQVGQPSGQGELPAGHPQIAKPQGDGQLPAGHPSLEQMQAAPATQPTSIGTLTVRAVQKTAGGPAIKGDALTVEIYDQDNMIKTVQAKLDDNGVAKIPDVPFGGTYGQFIRVNHAGLEYTAQVNAGQDVAVNCYESTEDAPAWNIKMRHMIVQPIEGGVQVTDVLAVENPADKAWIGRKDGDKRTTFTFAVPATASDVKLDGAFHECCVKVENGKLTNTMALWPGVNKYQVTYVLPAGKDGKAQIETSAPALTKNMIVMLPDDETAVSAVGLEGPSTVNMGGGNTRFFRGQDLKEGAEIKINVTTTPSTVKAAAPAKKTSSAINASQTGKLIAGAGGLLIFVVGSALMFLKAPKTAKRGK